jgi:mannose-1-phosphate guanylyltransferase
MHAVVLVGGFGTRLRPLTFSVPKPMLPVGHRPIVENLVGGLADAGITDVVLALGFKPEPFLAAFPDSKIGDVSLHYAVEPEPLDTAGAVRFAALHAGIDSTFVVVNGDVLTDLDLGALVRFHRDRGAEGTLHLTPVDDPSAYGVVDTDASGLVLRFVEKPSPEEAPSNLVNAGTYVLEPSVIDRIADGRRVSIEREVFPAMVADGTLYALPTSDYWLDTGQPEPYRRANLDLLAGVRRSGTCLAVQAGAEVDPTAVVVDSVVSSGAVIGADASVRGSVVLAGAHIESGADVSDSIVMGRVGVGATLSNGVIGADGVVPDGARLDGVRIPAPDTT